jgi:hypothetical protein
MAKLESRWIFLLRNSSFHYGDGGAIPAVSVEPIRTLAFATDAFSHTGTGSSRVLKFAGGSGRHLVGRAILARRKHWGFANACYKLPPRDEAGGDRPEQLVPAKHPIRLARPLAEAALRDLEPTFERMYAQIGRPSIPPAHLLMSCPLMARYSIRTERQFCERLRYDLLVKWLLDLNVEDDPFDNSSFAESRGRLLEHRISG